MLVVGAGKIALRKTRGLLEAGARITVVAPECEPEFEELPLRLVRRRFRASDLANALLVFAATNDRLTNHRIVLWPAHMGIVDGPGTMFSALNSRYGIIHSPISWGGSAIPTYWRLK